MENIVNDILMLKYNSRLKTFALKLLLKYIPTVSTINVYSDEKYLQDEEGRRNYNYFKNLVIKYKEKGYSKNQIIEVIDKEFKKYNLNFENLPKTIHELYDIS